MRFILPMLAVFAPFAAQANEAVASSGSDLYKPLGAALAIGLAAIGGALGQGRAASAALDGIARNPAAQNKIFIPLLLSLALTESLVILAFIVAFFKI
jgi:F-type H+-transporting ATPase subunit c